MANVAEDHAYLNESAPRFRSLTSTKGYFKLWDTMNVAILIAFYSGESFILAGVLAFMVSGGRLCLNQAFLIGVVFLAVLFVLTPIMVQQLLMDKESKRIKAEDTITVKIRPDQMEKCFELPKLEEDKNLK